MERRCGNFYSFSHKSVSVIKCWCKVRRPGIHYCSSSSQKYSLRSRSGFCAGHSHLSANHVSMELDLCTGIMPWWQVWASVIGNCKTTAHMGVIVRCAKTFGHIVWFYSVNNNMWSGNTNQFEQESNNNQAFNSFVFIINTAAEFLTLFTSIRTHCTHTGLTVRTAMLDQCV